MSFTSSIKEEIFNNVSDNKKCCIEAETFGEQITIELNKSDIELDKYFNISKLKECCIKSVLKGVFLSSGYVNDPNSIYHLEFIFKSKVLANYFIHLLNVLDLTPKITKRKSSGYIVYIKEAEQISNILSLLEANKSLLYFEEIRVEKNVKNNINRTINCEIYNLSKTLTSNNIQINAINKLKDNNKYNLLNDKLKEVANIRIEYPESNLKDLSLKLNLSKSGVKHRLDKIIEIASKF